MGSVDHLRWEFLRPNGSVRSTQYCEADRSDVEDWPTEAANGTTVIDQAILLVPPDEIAGGSLVVTKDPQTSNGLEVDYYIEFPLTDAY